MGVLKRLSSAIKFIRVFFCFLDLTLFHSLNRPFRLCITVITHLYSPVKKKSEKILYPCLTVALEGATLPRGQLAQLGRKKFPNANMTQL